MIQHLNYAVFSVFPSSLSLSRVTWNSGYEFHAIPTIILGTVSRRVLLQLFGNLRYADI